MTLDPNLVARVVGITTQFKDLRGGVAFLPQRIAVFAQGESAKVYSLDKFTPTTHGEVGARMGYRSPANLIARELLPTNGDGVGTIPVTFYPLDDDYEDVAATGSITPAGTVTKAGAFRARIGGVLSNEFVVPEGASVAARCDLLVAAINGVLHMPAIATDNSTNVGLAMAWAGASGNGAKVEILGPTDTGATWALVDTSGGLANPTVDDALARVGNVWETMALNALNHDDEAALDAFQTFGEGRWLPLVRKPWVVFRGYNGTTVEDVTEITDARPTDRVNVQLLAEGSPNLPFVIAARQLARIAKVANDNPPRDYGSQRATGLIPGADELQFDYVKRNAAVNGGSSTSEVRDGVVNISDVITSYAPEGEVPPAYRFVCDVVKLQQVIYNMDLKFKNPDWDGAPMIPDNQPTVNPSAKKPKMWIAAANSIIDALGLQAIISDPEAAKKKTKCTIDATNPKRYNGEITIQLAGNANVADITLNWGFYFGTPEVVG